MATNAPLQLRRNGEGDQNVYCLDGPAPNGSEQVVNLLKILSHARSTFRHRRSLSSILRDQRAILNYEARA